MEISCNDAFISFLDSYGSNLYFLKTSDTPYKGVKEHLYQHQMFSRSKGLKMVEQLLP